MIPILSAPGVDGSSDGMLGEAIAVAARKELVGPSDHVVCLLSVRDSLVLKIVSIDELGGGMVTGKKGTRSGPSTRCPLLLSWQANAAL